MKTRRKFTKEFKQTAVHRLNTGQNMAEVARALEVHPSDLHRWRRELQDHDYRTEYRNLANARACVGEFLEKIYNQKRLHSALSYRSPVEFENSLSMATSQQAVAV